MGIDNASPLWLNKGMKDDKRITVGFSKEQKGYIESIARSKFEGTFGRALRYVVGEAKRMGIGVNGKKNS